MKKTSKQFALDIWDILKAFLIAAISAAVPVIMESLNAGSMVFNWKDISIAALSGGLAYLVKNFFTPQKIVANPKEMEEQTP